ncbi:MAG TPA: hypothetical protein VNS57_14095 [Steroidobacteraceae bacterium]|nr:hypothetical protein [Steroidobacteraceae bacterium]
MNQHIARRGPVVASMVVSVVFALAGCASGESAKVSGAWAATAQKPVQPFAKVLVVGVSPNVKSRCTFERFMVANLGRGATQAIASCDVMDKQAPLSRELVEQAVAAQQADAVLSTLLVSQDWAPKSGGSRDTRGSAAYKATDSGWESSYYGTYSVPVIYGDFQANAASLVIEGEAHVASKLWETRSASVVYTVDTVVKGIESQDAGLSLVTSSIAGELSQRALVR